MSIKRLKRVSQKTEKRNKAKESKRLARMYPLAVSEAQAVRRDPTTVPENTLREMELGLRDRKFRISYGVTLTSAVLQLEPALQGAGSLFSLYFTLSHSRNE